MIQNIISLNKVLYLSSLFFVKFCDQMRKKYCIKEGDKTSNNLQGKLELDYLTLLNIFEIEPFFLKKQLTKNLNLSVPFNRNIKYIYSLPHYYIEYENYDFNKLSDFFLNIHIFIN